ncbi:MAG: hypothetical protein Q3974_03960 [Rothia sp. (in: high G+C Gram-positive bacteria)]|nr:hypothetical protein [Rothia sp. (in: high G+C Gram-positive bacteria)]
MSVISQEKLTVQPRVSKIQNSLKNEFNNIIEGTGKIVVIDFIVGFLMMFLGVAVLGMPLGTFVVLVYVAFKTFSKPKYDIRQINLFIAITLISLLCVTLTSLASDYSSTDQILRRLIRIVGILMFALYIGDRRIDLRSLLLGLSTAMVINAIAFYAGIAPDTYGGYLTGWIADKNVAGLYHAIVPLLMFVLFSKRWQRLFIVALALPLLWETGSRTSIGGFIIAIGWMLFAGKVNLFFKILLGGLVMWAFEWMQNQFASSAVFGDRTGTDWFRAQIDAASWEKVQNTPWHGMGLGQAVAQLTETRQVFFHNSYWTLFVEGGWPWTIGILGLTFLTVFVWKQPQQPQFSRKIGAEAAMVLLAICSWRLGEVMLTVCWAFAMGLALTYLASPRQTSQSDKWK